MLYKYIMELALHQYMLKGKLKIFVPNPHCWYQYFQ